MKDSFSCQLSTLAIGAERNAQNYLFDAIKIEQTKIVKECSDDLQQLLFLTALLIPNEEDAEFEQYDEKGSYFWFIFKGKKVVLLSKRQKKLLYDLITGKREII